MNKVPGIMALVCRYLVLFLLEAIGYRQINFISLSPADGYLATFVPPQELPPVLLIRPRIGEVNQNARGKEKK